MKKTTIVNVVLAVALIGSNLWWAYRLLDAGVTNTYQSAALEESQQALSQALAIIEAVGTGASREQIVAAASKAWSAGEPFDKDGYLWVGRLGLRFNADGRLVEVSR